jgi:hypothetical protein
MSGVFYLMAMAATAWQGAATDQVSETEPATLREMMDRAVEEVQIFANSEAKRPAKAFVALRWTNNTRGSEDGMTLLYIDKGRPLAAACLFPWQGHLAHDFESLSSNPILARRHGNIVWQPQKSGAKFADVPDAPAPEASRAQRLRQMKSLAGQFQSTMKGWKGDDTDREELRLLPRPLYRYEPAEDEEIVVDGAVFAFVMGTDPESLLLLEAIKDGEHSKWRYAFARRTSGELEGRHRATVVWTAAWLARRTSRWRVQSFTSAITVPTMT